MTAPASPQKWSARREAAKALLCLAVLLPLSSCKAPSPPASQPSATPYNNDAERPYREERRSRHHEDRGGDHAYNQDGGDNARGEDARGPGGGQSRHRNRAGRAANTPGSFDFYLLNLSWAPEYCYSHTEAPECEAHSTFVLHGLWPQNNDGSYPSQCSEAPGPADPGRYASLYPSTSLLQHEWREHGTCTGLTPEAYLSDARQAVQSVNIPPALEHLRAATSMPPQQILVLFQQSNPELPAASLALSCGNNFLTAVEVCFDKDLHPTACRQIRSCRANTVRIPAP